MIIIQAIKPRKRNIKVLAEIEKESRAIARDIGKSLAEDVKTWKNKPRFKATVNVSQRRATIEVSATGKAAEIYGYVDQGTRPHKIYPREAGGVLRFKWGGKGSYTPKTQPGRQGSTQSRQSGKIVYRAFVNHPGTKPRYFSRKIRRLYTASIARRFQDAMNRAVKK